jgi:hypothetical protein
MRFNVVGPMRRILPGGINSIQLLWMAGVGKRPIWKIVEMKWTLANERFLTCKIPRGF